jgi:trk system potassium uptake protein
MINLKIIYKIVGSLLFIEMALLLVCLGVSIGYGESDREAFAVSVGVTGVCGLLLRLLAHDSDNTLSRRDAYMVVTLTWVIFSLFGMLPFLISGYIPDVTDAFFETMSGFTTTGASIIDNIDNYPHGLLFWRSLTQWIGGLGIVFFTITLLPSLVGGSVKVFAAEATGPIKTKLHPRLSTNSKWIWVVYFVITFLCFSCLCAVGMDVFDSVNYAMVTAATGGFATKSSLVLFTPEVQYVIMFFCFVSGTNFTLLYASVSRRSVKMLFGSAEFKFYFWMVAGISAFITFELMWRNSYPLEHAIRSAVFHVVSFITTTGLINDDAGK